MRDADVIEELRAKLAIPTGRHLYGVLGAYAALCRFALALQQAPTPRGRSFPAPLSVNRGILHAIPDEECKQLVTDEARYPQPARAHVQQAFEQSLRDALSAHDVVVLEHLEMFFAYGVDLTLLRTVATDADQVILLLPGRRAGGRISMFFEEDAGFNSMPGNLIAANHLWDLGG